MKQSDSTLAKILTAILLLVTALGISGLIWSVSPDRNLNRYVSAMPWLDRAFFALTMSHVFLVAAVYRRYLIGRMRADVWFGSVVAFQLVVSALSWHWLFPETENGEIPTGDWEQQELVVAIWIFLVGVAIQLLVHWGSRLVFRKFWKQKFDQTGKSRLTLKTLMIVTALVAVIVTAIIQNWFLPMCIRTTSQNLYSPETYPGYALAAILPSAMIWWLLFRWQAASGNRWFSGLAMLSVAPLLALLGALLDPYDFRAGDTVRFAIGIWVFALVVILWHYAAAPIRAADTLDNRRRSWFARTRSAVGWIGRCIAQTAAIAIWIFIPVWFVVHWFAAGEESGATFMHRSLVEANRGDPDQDDDWLMSLNRKLGHGIAPEENAAAIIVRLRAGELFGEEVMPMVPAAVIKEYFQKLGFDEREQEGLLSPKEPEAENVELLIVQAIEDQIKASPQDFSDAEKAVVEHARDVLGGESQLSFNERDRGRRYITNRMDCIYETPWSDKEFPPVAAWMEAQEEQLDRLRDASKLKFYSPFVRLDPQLEKRRGFRKLSCHPFNPGLNSTIVACKLLRFSALRNMGNGDIDAAIADIEAIRDFCQPEVLLQTIDPLRGLYRGQAMIHSGFELILQASSSVDATPQQQQRLRELIDEFPQPSELVKSDWVELPKWLRKDMIWKGLVGKEDRFHINQIEDSPLRYACEKMPWLVDWKTADEKLDQEHQEVLDSFVLDSGEPNHEMDFGRFSRAPRFPPLTEINKMFLFAGPKTKSQWLGFHYNSIDVYGRFGNGHGYLKAIILLMTKRRLVKTALALESWRRKQGTYPQTLAQLVPEYLTAIPIDPYSSSDLLYVNDQKTGTVVFSVGGDGESAGGSDLVDIILQLNKRGRLDAKKGQLLNNTTTPDLKTNGKACLFEIK